MNLKRLPAGTALWAILALALALRVAGGVWSQSRLGPGCRFEFGDSDGYWVLAQHIAHWESFEYGSPDARVYRMPGYPALLAAMMWLFGDDMPVFYARVLGAVLGTLAVAAVCWLATTLFDRRTGLLAALLAACYPGAIATSVFVLSEAPFCPLFLGQLAAWIKSWQAEDPHRSLFWAALSGMLGGLATLMRPDWLLFIPCSVLIGAVLTSIQPIQNRKSKIQNLKRHVAIVSVMMLLFAMLLAPWWWRNARLIGHFVPTTLQVGASLYDGLNPKAEGASEMSFVREFAHDEQRNPSLPGEPFEYRLDRRLWQAALDWAANHPARVLQLAAIKFVRMWNVWPNDPQNRGGPLCFVTAVTFVPAIMLALAGIWLTRRQLWPTALCWLPAVYLTLLHVIFVSSIRYREPPMLGLLVFTAAFLTRGIRPSPAQ